MDGAHLRRDGELLDDLALAPQVVLDLLAVLGHVQLACKQGATPVRE